MPIKGLLWVDYACRGYDILHISVFDTDLGF